MFNVPRTLDLPDLRPANKEVLDALAHTQKTIDTTVIAKIEGLTTNMGTLAINIGGLAANIGDLTTKIIEMKTSIIEQFKTLPKEISKAMRETNTE